MSVVWGWWWGGCTLGSTWCTSSLGTELHRIVTLDRGCPSSSCGQSLRDCDLVTVQVPRTLTSGKGRVAETGRQGPVKKAEMKRLGSRDGEKTAVGQRLGGKAEVTNTRRPKRGGKGGVAKVV